MVPRSVIIVHCFARCCVVTVVVAAILCVGARFFFGEMDDSRREGVAIWLAALAIAVVEATGHARRLWRESRTEDNEETPTPGHGAE
jgi:hypothetical protein